jgi:hypothetical protein
MFRIIHQSWTTTNMFEIIGNKWLSALGVWKNLQKATGSDHNTIGNRLGRDDAWLLRGYVSSWIGE